MFDPFYSRKRGGTGPRAHDRSPHRGRARRTDRRGVDGRPRLPASPWCCPSTRRREMASILIVDDEASARSTLALLLRKRHHRVTEADGVTAAVKALVDEVFEVVVTDLRMPDGDGLDVLRASRAHCPDADVILLTAYAGWESAKEAIQLGAVGLLREGPGARRVASTGSTGRWPRTPFGERTRTSARRFGTGNGLPGLLAGSAADGAGGGRGAAGRAHERHRAHPGRVGDGQGGHRQGPPSRQRARRRTLRRDQLWRPAGRRSSSPSCSATRGEPSPGASGTPARPVRGSRRRHAPARRDRRDGAQPSR